MKPQIARWAIVTSHLSLVDVAIKPVSSAVKCKTLKKYSRQAELAKKEGNRIESKQRQTKPKAMPVLGDSTKPSSESTHAKRERDREREAVFLAMVVVCTLGCFDSTRLDSAGSARLTWRIRNVVYVGTERS